MQENEVPAKETHQRWKKQGVRRNKQLGKSNQADQHQAARTTCLSLYHDSSKLACWQGAQINEGRRHLSPGAVFELRLALFYAILLSGANWFSPIHFSLGERGGKKTPRAITHQNDTGIKVRRGACDSTRTQGGRTNEQHLRGAITIIIRPR